VLILGITVHCVAVPELFHVLSPFPGLHLIALIWSGTAAENSNIQI